MKMVSRHVAWSATLLMIVALSFGAGSSTAAAATATDTIVVSLSPIANSGNGGTDPCPVTVQFNVKVLGTAPDFVNPAYGSIELFVDGSSVGSKPLVEVENGATFTISFASGGNSTVHAVYTDGPDYTGSTSPPIAQQVNCAGGAPTPATLGLTPATATNTVGTPHTVTATVTDATNSPISGVTVRFSVTGANSASGFSATNASGQATFTYTGTTAGADAITAYADTNGNGAQDPGEPGGTATKIWTSIITQPPAGPTSADQCKKDGWKIFSGLFKNMGDCISFAASVGRNQPNGFNGLGNGSKSQGKPH